MTQEEIFNKTFEENFELGMWLLLDGLTDCQYIHPSADRHTVDINGRWVDVYKYQLQKHPKYSTNQQSK